VRIIEGYQSARKALSRQAPDELLDTGERQQAVRQIINDVREKGDAALFEFTSKFDGVSLDSLEISKEQISIARKKVDPELVSALELAAERIRSFHDRQRESLLRDSTESNTGWLMRPLERVGIYVPGGTAPLPSSLLMTAIPARVAGVKEVFVTTPPGSNGIVPPIMLAAADIANVDRVFSIGGAQAIAALAFGTDTVPRVDKIYGPGNIYVLLAKKMVYGIVGIDALQGPSEVLIIADDSAEAEYCTTDLLAQAEHGAHSSAILVTTSRLLADKVNRQVGEQIKNLSRKDIATQSLSDRGIITIVASIDEAIEMANLYAPEHLCLMVRDSDYCVDRLTNAGCIITGGKSTAVLGDYVAGPSHVLPTEGTARFSSPLNVNDFVKITNIINVDDTELKQIGSVAATIARAEGLDAHARAVEKRLEKNK